jgi:hypothetical protein
MRGLWGYSRVKILLGLPLVLLLVTCCFGADSLVVYQVGAKEQQSWTVFKDFFREKGYDVFFHQDETTLEKHLERIGKINRGPSWCLAKTGVCW